MGEANKSSEEESKELIKDAKVQLEQSKKLISHSRLALEQIKEMTEKLKEAKIIPANWQRDCSEVK